MVKCETIAIDFGTSFSRVGVFQNGKPVLVKFAGGKEQFPSVVAFTENELLMGDDAFERIDLNPKNTISRIKQAIGGVPKDAELDFGYLPLGVKKKDSNLVFEVQFEDGLRDVYPEELMTLLIRRMKHKAEEFLGHEVRRAVISVPASYNNSKRRTTHEAGIQAGFEQVFLINEPTAAAIHHSNARQYVESKNAVIVCLGGGSFDVSVVSTSRNHVTVKATAGNYLLGGAAFDQRMVEHVIAEMNKIYRKNTGKTSLAHQIILNACERAKKIISVQSSTEVSVEIIGALTMSQFIFERLCEDLFGEIEATIKSVLRESGISTTEPYDVVFAGESTQMSKIRRMFPHKTEQKEFIYSDRIVISGALSFVKILESIREGDVSSFSVDEVLSNPLSIRTSDGDYRIFERNEPVPSEKIVYIDARNNQEYAFAKVIDGERKTKNFMIDNLYISQIPKSEGKKVIEIVFCLDGNGVHVAKAKTKLHGIEHKLKVSVEKRNPLSMFDSLNIEWNNGRALFKSEKQRKTSSQSNARGFLDGTQSKTHPESIGDEKRNESLSDFKEKTKTTMNETEVPADNQTSKKQKKSMGASASQRPIKSKKMIGIDFGTTYSSAAVYINGEVEVIENEESKRRTPSIVSFTEKEFSVGGGSWYQGSRNITNIIFNTKRLIGKQGFSAIRKSEERHLSYFLEENEDGPTIRVQHKGKKELFTPEEISAMIIRKMKQNVEKYIGEEVTDAVITVPAYFNNHQRQATIDAASIAGLTTVRLLNEPTAAAMAYVFSNRVYGRKNVLFCRIGGGSCDFSIVNISNGDEIEVKSSFGDSHFGGTDFDERLVQHFADIFRKEHRIDIFHYKKMIYRLRLLCEEAKQKLSRSSLAQFEVDFLGDDILHSISISRKEFEEICKPLLQKPVELVKKVLENASMTKQDIHDIVLIGGSTRITKIQSSLKDFFDGKEFTLSINTDESAVEGAALLAESLSGSRDVRSAKIAEVRDITPFAIEFGGGNELNVELFHAMTPTPAVKEHTFYPKTQHTVCKLFEHEFANNSNYIGEFDVDDGVTFKFTINESGTVDVTKFGCSRLIPLQTPRKRFSERKIQEMITRARAIEKEKEEYHMLSEAENALEEEVLIAKQYLKDNRDDMSPEDVKKLTEACEEATKLMESNRDATKRSVTLAHKRLKELIQEIMDNNKSTETKL